MPQLKEDWSRIRIEEVGFGGIVSYAFLGDAGWSLPVCDYTPDIMLRTGRLSDLHEQHRVWPNPFAQLQFFSKTKATEKTQVEK